MASCSNAIEKYITPIVKVAKHGLLLGDIATDSLAQFPVFE